LTETRKALDQQTATSEVLEFINSSPGDLTPVFEALLDKALMLCGGTFGIIRTYDGDSFHLGAMRGVPSETAELIKQPRRPPFTGMVALERLIAGEPVVEIGDPRDLAGYRAGAPTIQAMVNHGGARTGLWVALAKEAELLGFIWVYRQEIRPFTDRQIALLQNFANQAVIAIENARLLTETREALEHQTATAEVLQVINSSPGNLTPVFEAILEKATHLSEANSGIFWIYQGDDFRPAAYIGTTEAFANFLRQHAGVKPSSRSLDAIQHGEQFVHNIDPAEINTGSVVPLARAVVDLEHPRTGLLVPLLKDGALLGAIRIFAVRCGRFPTSRSRCCGILRRRRSLRWRMRGS
jgi:GAF domain-containing protein